jgi:hypothetical protein
MIAELQQIKKIQTNPGMDDLLRIIKNEMLVVSQNGTSSSYRMSSRNVFDSLGSMLKNHPEE